MYDAIVVGARCAGSPTAMLLAREGHRVLVVDRDTFPSDTLSTAYMLPDAVFIMDGWGLRERLEAAGTPPVFNIVVHLGGTRIPLQPTPIATYAPRRTVLDKILVDAAREAGAEVREGFSAREVLRDSSGRVTGIRGRTAGGAEVTEKARIVIGADGRNSIVAKAVQAEEYDVVPGASCGYYSYYAGFPQDVVEVHYGGRYVFFAFPSNDGLACIALEAPAEFFEAFREDPDGFLARSSEEFAPSFHQQLIAAKREDKWYGMSRRTSFYRKPYGPGWALVGDAGFLKDPILGTGINDAFRDAELLAKAVATGLRDESSMIDALAGYSRTRDEVSKPWYDLVCEFGEMKGVTPDMLMRLNQARGRALV